MTKDQFLHMRISGDEKNMLRQLAEQAPSVGMSELVRAMVRFTYDSFGQFLYFLEKEETDESQA